MFDTSRGIPFSMRKAGKETGRGLRYKRAPEGDASSLKKSRTGGRNNTEYICREALLLSFGVIREYSFF